MPHSRPRKPAAPPLPYALTWEGKNPPESAREISAFRRTDAFEAALPADGCRNRLLWGDNLGAMEALLPEFRGQIDLIYLDPPFNVGQEFHFPTPIGEDRGMGADRGQVVRTPAYRDVWDGGAYLRMLHPRLRLMRELLAPAGSLIVHVDWRAGHLVQVLLDELFGPGERSGPGQPGFRNELVWGYGGGGHVRNAYRRKHDNLFWYTKGETWTFNPQYRPYTEGTRKRGLTAVKGPRYALREEGAQLETWWTDAGVQKILSPTAAENLKYPTQKPEALLERILTGHSNRGDLVADFCCGSGVTPAVAERMGRRWIAADESRAAVLLTRKRLAGLLHDAEPRRAFDLYRAGSAPEPAEGRVAAEWFRRADGTWDLRLASFQPLLPEDCAPELHQRAAARPLDFIDYWAVDWSGDGSVFNHGWRAYRTPSQRRLALETDARRPTADANAKIMAVDVWGNEWIAPIP